MFKEIIDGLNARVDHLFKRIIKIDWDMGPGTYPCEEETKVERKYDKRLLLKIKLKSLMAEVKIIREQEEKLKPAAKRGAVGAQTSIEEMAAHRRKDIRYESRATLLAYNFIRGRTYEQTEPNVKPEPSGYVQKRVERIVKMCALYGGASVSRGAILEAQVRAWMKVDPSGARTVV